MGIGVLGSSRGVQGGGSVGLSGLSSTGSTGGSIYGWGRQPPLPGPPCSKPLSPGPVAVSRMSPEPSEPAPAPAGALPKASAPWPTTAHQGTLDLSQGLVLVINAGSSSLKAALMTPEGTPLWRDQRPCDGEGALEALLAEWVLPALEPMRAAIRLVAHRVVHGGERFLAPSRLGPAEIGAIAELVPLAPLHNAPALAAIRWFAEREPAWPQAAGFDTAFHRSLPAAASTYAIPAAWREQGLRRYGFHGLNHQHISEVVAERFPGLKPLRLISCHLGAGCSLCAIGDGLSLDTTMGFTPLEGLVMASRSGSLDPGLLLHLLRQGLSPAALDQALNHASGLLGLSGLSGSMQALRQAAAGGHGGAQLAIAVFRHRLLAAIGAMAASLGGVDVIALSGGIGEHDSLLAQELRLALDWLNPFALVVIPADEEGLLARSCWPLVQTSGPQS